MEASTPAPESAPTPDPVSSSNKTVAIIAGVVLVVVAVGLIIFFATRQSEEEKALQAVCTSRAEIEQSVTELSGTNVGNFSIDNVKSELDTIRNGIKTIQANEPKLGVDRRAQIKAANQAMANSIKQAANDFIVTSSVNETTANLKAAGQDLVDAYNQSLQPIDCTGVELDN
jgi:type VI protein secretion system component VasK